MADVREMLGSVALADRERVGDGGSTLVLRWLETAAGRH